MVRHLKVPEIQHNGVSTTATTTSTSSSPAYSPLSIRIPSPNLLHPLIHETSTNAAVVSDYIPGLKTSAAFLSSLRANIYLSSTLLDPCADYRFPPSPNPSLAPTPFLGPTIMSPSAENLQPPASETEIALAAHKDPLAGVPSLTTYTAKSEDDLVSALRLIGDSVAQQRQYASRQLIFHPAVLTVWVAILAIVAQYLYKGRSGDLLVIATTWAGLIMAGLLGIRFVTGSYLELAEKTGTWKWLGKDSDIIITKFGDEVIGAVVVLTTKSDSTNASNAPTTPTSSSSSGSSSPTRTSANRRHRKSQSRSSPNYVPLRGLIRAWTVKYRYRHKGIGGGLLEEAVRLCKSRGVQAQNIEFADDHANSARVVPEDGRVWSVLHFNGGMRRKEEGARGMLGEVVGEIMGEAKGRRRRGS